MNGERFQRTQAMDLSNCTRVTEFILLAYPRSRTVTIALFMVILLLYLLCITGNSLIIVLVCTDHLLQKPMYFFLSNFSVIEMGHTSAFMPKMLNIFLSAKATICFNCCMAQSYFYYLFGVTEFFILTLISVDRYLAICQPLRYNTIMTPHVCLQVALVAWVAGFFSNLPGTLFTLRFPFCGSNSIDHFFCDIGATLKISGGDTRFIEVLGFLITMAVVLTSLLLTVVSYSFIITTILRVPSSSGHQKAFSTCVSHLIVVSILYGAVLFIYLRPSITDSSTSVVKAVSILNTMVAPVLNPFIYTLRNNEFKDALRRAIGKKALTFPKL
ncbi:olfactory receptor 6X1-like [Tiliqua scincoides]|uniref:olfactory receptor 6X1-like n=1 Tax=Tiliqua scincoides TaxID=71010 RepID=UPI003463397A